MIVETGKIYTIKLTTGEEIVTKVLEIGSEDLIIENPIVTVLTPKGLQMMPCLFSAAMDQKIRLNKSSCVMLAQCRDDVSNSWIHATTGIEPVTRKIITG